MEKIQTHVSKRLEGYSKTMVVDSVPIAVFKLAKETSCKLFRASCETDTAKGYSAVNKGWFIGYKLHVVIWDNRVAQQSGLTKRNVHDIKYLKQVGNPPEKKELLGDRAYLSKGLQLNLFEQYRVKLKVPFRRNQHDYKRYPKRYRSKRQRIEIFFSQLGDQMNIKRNYARLYVGLVARLTAK